MRERKCIVTKQSYEISKLIRFVVDPTGAIIPDLSMKLPGRSVWVVADHHSLSTAIDKNILLNACKQFISKQQSKTNKTSQKNEILANKHLFQICPSSLHLSDSLRSDIECGLRDRLISLLSIARRSNQILFGFEKIVTLLKQKRSPAAFACLVIAQNAGVDGRKKLSALVKGQANLVRICEIFGDEELGRIAGQESLTYAALRSGPFANKWIIDFEKYERLTRCDD